MNVYPTKIRFGGTAKALVGDGEWAAVTRQTMYFEHSNEIWRDFPDLIAGAVHTDGIASDAAPNGVIAEFTASASSLLLSSPEGELPAIQAWRRAFSRMGLKPTQYRCASEALLRRFRKEQALPRLHPLVDLCNAASMAFATPVAAFDIHQIGGDFEVRYATGAETFVPFAGPDEHPEPGEVIFVDTSRRAHSRRCTNRQSGASAVREGTSEVVIIAEALHATAEDDVEQLLRTLSAAIEETWSGRVRSAVITSPAAVRNLTLGVRPRPAHA